VNMIMDTMGALALATEPPRDLCAPPQTRAICAALLAALFTLPQGAQPTYHARCPFSSLMDRKPYGRTEAIISNIMWRNLLVQAAYQLIVLFVLYFSGCV